MGRLAVQIPDSDGESDESIDDPTEQQLHKYHESPQLRKMFVGNLAYECNVELLRDYFSKFGNIEDCNVPQDSRTRLSKGFGFVTFRRVASIDEVMCTRPHKLEGRVLEPRRSLRREVADDPTANASTTKLYIGPLHHSITERELENYFSEHGKILEISLKSGKDHAFITFDDFDPIDKLVNMKRHRIVQGFPCAIAKKALTRRVIEEAERRYVEKKKRREQRETRENLDYESLKRYGRLMPGERHRDYPGNFGREGDSNGDYEGHVHYERRREQKRSRRRYRSESSSRSPSPRRDDRPKNYSKPRGSRRDRRSSSSESSRSRSPADVKGYKSRARSGSPRLGPLVRSTSGRLARRERSRY